MNVYWREFFPLVLCGDHWSRYFVDGNGDIYSTRSGVPVKLKGTTRGEYRIFTLDGRRVRQDIVINRAKQHKDYSAYIGDAQTEKLKNSGDAQTEKLKNSGGLNGREFSIAAAIPKRGFMLASLNEKGNPIFAHKPVFHDKEATAEEEAIRISGLTGKKVVIFKIIGAVKVGGAVWE